MISHKCELFRVSNKKICAPRPLIIVLTNSKTSQGRARSLSVAGAVTQLPPFFVVEGGVANVTAHAAYAQRSRADKPTSSASSAGTLREETTTTLALSGTGTGLTWLGLCCGCLQRRKRNSFVIVLRVMPLNLNRPRSRPGVNETCAYVHSPQQWVITTMTTWMRSRCARELI